MTLLLKFKNLYYLLVKYMESKYNVSMKNINHNIKPAEVKNLLMLQAEVL